MNDLPDVAAIRSEFLGSEGLVDRPYAGLIVMLCDEIERLHRLVDQLTEVITSNDLVGIEWWVDSFEGWDATLLIGLPENITRELAEHLLANGGKVIDGQWRGVRR